MRNTAKAVAPGEKRHVRPIPQEPAAPAVDSLYLNGTPTFWEVYRMRQGSVRRKALMDIFRAHPKARLPVNNRWQANTVDADLSVLLKRGALKRMRDGGGTSHHLNKSSSKRQTYLVLT